MNRITVLDQMIKAAGVPIDGVSGSDSDCRIDFRPEATKAQRDQAAAIVAAFDFNAPPSADEKTAAVAELSDAKLTAAHNEILYALANKQTPPAWALDLVNAAHLKIAQARQ